MATLREYVLNQSTLPTGNTVRNHILNPDSLGDEYILEIQGCIVIEKEITGILKTEQELSGVISCK